MNTLTNYIKNIHVLRFIGACFILYFTIKIIGGHNYFLLSNINLIFHESGHMIFMFFGRTLTILGGTLMQIIVPFIVIIHFLRKQDYYASALFLWWLGENIVNISIYIADSNVLVLPLLGGGQHDWNTLLADWQLLIHAELIGQIVWYSGILVMCFGFVWMVIKSQKSTPTQIL